MPAVEVRKIVLLMTVGLCEALEKKSIAADEAESVLFSPWEMSVFKNDAEVHDILHAASELEDIERLVPEAFADAVAEVKRRALQALASSPPVDSQQDRWLYKLSPRVGS